MAEEIACERCAVCCLCVYHYEWCVEALRKNTRIASHMDWTLAKCWVHTLESFSRRVTVAECWCGGVGVTQTVGCWWPVTEVFQLKYTGLKCSCVRACELVLLLSCCAVLINRRQHLLSEFRMCMREVQSVSWSYPQHCTLCSNLHAVPRTNYRSHVSVFCRLYICILSFSIFWRPDSGVRVTVVWDVTPCRLAHVYQLPLLYGVRGSKFVRNVRWYHSVRRHVLDYRILVHLLQPHTVPCSALLLCWGENVVRIGNCLCSVPPAKCWDSCL